MFHRKKRQQKPRQRRFGANTTINVTQAGTSRLGVLRVISGYARAGDRLYVHDERKHKGRIILYMYGPNRAYACSAVLQNGNFQTGDTLHVDN